MIVNWDELLTFSMEERDASMYNSFDLGTVELPFDGSFVAPDFSNPLTVATAVLMASLTAILL